MGSQFPGLPNWLVIVSHNDAGILLTAMIAFAGFVWLYNARFFFPRLLPLARVGIVFFFYLTFFIMVLR